jgi:hypothetical protein
VSCHQLLCCYSAQLPWFTCVLEERAPSDYEVMSSGFKSRTRQFMIEFTVDMGT